MNKIANRFPTFLFLSNSFFTILDQIVHSLLDCPWSRAHNATPHHASSDTAFSLNCPQSLP
jgi:hypothetical protein